MARKLITKKELAELSCRSQKSITNACRGLLKPAVVGTRIDPSHPEVKKYITAGTKAFKQSQAKSGIPVTDPLYPNVVEFLAGGGERTVKRVAQYFNIGPRRAEEMLELIEAAEALNVAVNGRTSISPTAERELPSAEDVPDDQIEDLSDWPLRDLLHTFGTEDRFKTWLQTRKAMVDISEKVIRNAERRGQLIPRDFVQKHVINQFERAFVNLLSDAAQTIAEELTAQIKAGASREDCQEIVSSILSSHIEAAKAHVKVAMREVE